MNSTQMRMARAALRWGVRELAEKAGVTANTITRIENGSDAKRSTLDAIQAALEAAGMRFIEARNGLGPGVRTAYFQDIPEQPDEPPYDPEEEAEGRQ